MNEKKAVAILIGNLKGSKNKPSDLITLSIAVKTLLNHSNWGIKEMSDYFKISEYMIRQIAHIDDLQEPLKKIVINNKLRIEVSYHLWRVQNQNKRPLKEIIQVGNIMKNMSSEDVRTFMYNLSKFQELTVSECKELVDQDKPKNIRFVMIPLNENQFASLEKKSKEKKLKVADYILKKILRVTV